MQQKIKFYFFGLFCLGLLGALIVWPFHWKSSGSLILSSVDEGKVILPFTIQVNNSLSQMTLLDADPGLKNQWRIKLNVWNVLNLAEIKLIGLDQAGQEWVLFDDKEQQLHGLKIDNLRMQDGHWQISWGQTVARISGSLPQGVKFERFKLSFLANHSHYLYTILSRDIHWPLFWPVIYLLFFIIALVWKLKNTFKFQKTKAI